MTDTPLLSARRLWLMALLLAFLVIGLRCALIERFTPPLPSMDQWDAEGTDVFEPWFQHRNIAANLIAPHNEHRVALTRVLALALVLVNGQWDQRLEAAVNTLLPALLAGGLLVMAGRRLPPRLTAAAAVLLAVAFAGPFAWENIVSGFDSQQFFLIDLAVLGLATLPFAPPFSGRWWVGAAAVLLSLGSMATGFFAALVCLVLLLFRVRRHEERPAAAMPAIALSGLVVAAGIAGRTTHPGHAILASHSVSDFLLSFARYAGWPAFDSNWGYAGLLLWAPWAALLWAIVRPRPGIAAPWRHVLAALGLWVLLQMAATAYARGAGGQAPAPRYLDTALLGIVVNALCLATLLADAGDAAAGRRPWLRLGAVWAGLLLFGLAFCGFVSVPRQMDDLERSNRYGEANVRNYLATGDPAYLEHDEIPYPSWQGLRQDLDSPVLRELLPADVRRPLAVARAPGSTGFVRTDTRSPQGAPPRVARTDGFSPATPLLANAVAFGSYGPGGRSDQGVWRSEPLEDRLGGWLCFTVAGDLGGPGLSLSLLDAASGRRLAEITRSPRPGDGWHTVFVRAPGRPFVIQAVDRSRGGWLAFAEPVPVGELSYWAWRLCRHGWLMAALAATGLCAAILPVAAGRSGTSPRRAST